MVRGVPGNSKADADEPPTRPASVRKLHRNSADAPKVSIRSLIQATSWVASWISEAVSR
jgi:hypothetical protein